MLLTKLKNPFLILIAALVSLNLGLVVLYFYLPEASLRLKVYDVGQGDASLITTPKGYKILVDGGPDNKVINWLGRDLPFWDRKIDFVILTHPQADHLTGLVETIKRYQIGTIIISGVDGTTEIYRQWELALKEKKIEPQIVTAGDELVFPDQTKIRFIWPREAHPAVNDLNMASLVFKLSYGSFDAYMTGDADSQVQPYSQADQIEVLKVPHHGSKTALKEDYLSQLKPQVSIISAGTHNRYGHPNAVTLQALQRVGSTIYRTDQNGSVEVVSDGKSWYTKPEKGN